MPFDFDMLSISPVNTGGGPSVNVSALNITPTTSAQSFVANVGEAYSPVNVSGVNASIDSNITAANIVNGVNILGVIGTASASAPKEVASYKIYDNGVAAANDQDVTGMFNIITNVQPYAFEYAFYNKPITGDAVFNGVTVIENNGAFSHAFEKTNINSLSFPQLINIQNYTIFTNAAANCRQIKYADFGRLEYTSSSAFNSAFSFSTIESANFGSLRSPHFNRSFSGSGLKDINLSAVEYVSSQLQFESSFDRCNNMTEFYLNSFQRGDGQYQTTYVPFRQTFNLCQNLSYVYLPVKRIDGSYYFFYQTFLSCPKLLNMSYDRLYYISTANAFSYAYQNSGIQNLSFPALRDFGSSQRYFINMLSNVNGCTVHFPASLEATMNSWSDVSAGFGGTNTTILFDLPSISSPDNFDVFYNMTNSGEIGGQTFAVGASSESYNAWMAMNSQDISTGWHSATQEAPHYFEMYAPYGISLDKMETYTYNSVNTETNTPQPINICVSNDGTNWEELPASFSNGTFSNPSLGTNGTFVSINIVNSTKDRFYYKYHRLYFNSYQNNPSYLTTINHIDLRGTYRY